MVQTTSLPELSVQKDQSSGQKITTHSQLLDTCWGSWQLSPAPTQGTPAFFCSGFLEISQQGTRQYQLLGNWAIHFSGQMQDCVCVFVYSTVSMDCSNALGVCVGGVVVCHLHSPLTAPRAASC